MRTDGRTVAVALAVALLWLAPVGQATAGPVPTHQAWARTGSLGQFVATEGDLYVAATAGGEDTRSFVALGGLGDPTGLSLVLHETKTPGSSAAADLAVLKACALAAPLARSGEIADPPGADCRAQAAPVRDADGTWRLPLAPFASFWADDHPTGLVLFPDLEAQPALPASPVPLPVAVPQTASFRVAFAASATTIEGTAVEPGRAPDTVTGAPPITATVDPPTTPPFTPTPTVVADVTAPVAAPGLATTPEAFPDTVAATAPVLAIAASPSAAAALLVFVVGTVVVFTIASRRHPGMVAALAPSRWGGHPDTGRQVLTAGAIAAAALAPLVASDVTIFKLGLVALLAVTAMGLHVLVNWAGELSLAHAAFTGLPAFAVAKLSADHDISAIHLLPVGIVVGALLGAVVGLPSLRARGIQVAVVTLAAGIGVDRFFFTKSWLVGPPQGVTIAETTLGPIGLSTQRSLWLFLVGCVVLAALVVRALNGSTVGRAWRWLRADPAAAAAFGVDVARYKVAAYAVAGAFAGFGGGLTVVWVELATAQSFPTSLSFTYLIVVVLAGRGLVGGVLAAAVLLEGGRQFAGSLSGWIDYVGPVALVVVLTRYRAGLTGIGGSLMRIVKDSNFAAALAARAPGDDEHLVTSSMVAGCVLTALGFGSIGLAWYHIGNTDQVWIQTQEMVSGGLGGMAAIILGAALLIRDQLIRNRVHVDRGDR